MSGFFDPPPIVDERIYCRARGVLLQDEHIIPYGLTGVWKLVAASCEPCARITSAFERSVLRESFLATRTALDFRTYLRKRRPASLPLEVDRGRGAETLHLPIEDHPAILGLPRFPLSSWIVARSSTSGIETIRVQQAHFGTLDPVSFIQKYAGLGLTGSVPLVDAVAFARMLAKIAYSYCVGLFGFAPPSSGCLTTSEAGSDPRKTNFLNSRQGQKLESTTWWQPTCARVTS